jgi:hypothetical protein
VDSCSRGFRAVSSSKRLFFSSAALLNNKGENMKYKYDIDSIKDGICDKCKKNNHLYKYNGELWCNDCIQGEEHGEKANN